MWHINPLFIANTDHSCQMCRPLPRQSQGCGGTAGPFANGESTPTWLFLSLTHVLWKRQARKPQKRGCLKDTGFTKDSRPWSDGEDFSRALQLCCWECTPSNMHMLQKPAPGTVIISYKAKQHQQELVRQWLECNSANGCFGSHSFWQVKDPIFSSCKWELGKLSLLCCIFCLRYSTPEVSYPNAWEVSEAQGMPLHISLRLTWVLA